MTSGIPFPDPPEEAGRWIANPAPHIPLAILRDDELIGGAGYTIDEAGTSAELGYWIAKDHWNLGFATEATAALIRHLSQVAGLNGLTCGHFVDNRASKRVIEKLGFRYLRTSREYSRARKHTVETLHYEQPVVFSEQRAK